MKDRYATCSEKASDMLWQRDLRASAAPSRRRPGSGFAEALLLVEGAGEAREALLAAREAEPERAARRADAMATENQPARDERGSRCRVRENGAQ